MLTAFPSFGPSAPSRAFHLRLFARQFSNLTNNRSLTQCQCYLAIGTWTSSTDFVAATQSAQSILTGSSSSLPGPRHAKASSTVAPEFSPLPYYVPRTASRELPIYQLTKRGGNLRQTRIRKIDGDRAKLLAELQSALRLKPENITINQVTGHIIIKVWCFSLSVIITWKLMF